MGQPSSTASHILAKNTILNLGGMILPLIVGVFCIPFAIKGLGTKGFGIFSIIWVVFGYFSLLDFGLSKSTTKYVSELVGNEKEKSIPSIVWTAVIISIGLGIIGSIVIISTTSFLINDILKIGVEFSQEAQKSFLYTAIGLPVILVSTSFQGVLGAAQRFDLVNLVFVPVSILNFVIPALSFPYNLSLSQVVMIIVVVRVCAVIAYLILCLRIFPILKHKFQFDMATLPKLITYGGWVTVTSIVSPILVYMDRFFIGAILSVAVVAYYTAPYDMINRMRILPIALMKTLFPELSAMSYHKRSERITTLFIRAIKYIFLPISVVAGTIFIYAPEILQIWLGNQFSIQASGVLRIVSLGIILNSLAYIPFSLLQGIGRPDLPAKFHLIEFPIYVILIWILTKNFGLNGAAIAWLLRISLDFILLYRSSLKLYKITLSNIISNKILAEIVGVVLLFICLGIIDFSVKVMFIKIGITIFSLLIFALITWRYFFDDREKQILLQLLKT